MRRKAAVLAVVLALVATAGCTGLPAGVDGDVTGGWPAMPAAEQFRPGIACHAELDATATVDDYAPVPCTGPHLTETFAVADMAGIPAGGEPDDQTARAYRECSARATKFVGGDWRTGWLVLQPALPSRAAWSGGARWVRCDLVETSPVDGSLVRRSASVRHALKGAGKLRMTCANATIKGDRVTEMHAVGCATKHTAEFAGLFTSKRRTSADITPAELEKGCTTTIATFAGIPNDGTVENRVGWLGFPPDDDAWQAGDRAIRCFLWLNGEKMTGSYRNAGTSKLRIHYVNR